MSKIAVPTTAASPKTTQEQTAIKPKTTGGPTTITSGGEPKATPNVMQASQGANVNPAANATKSAAQTSGNSSDMVKVRDAMTGAGFNSGYIGYNNGKVQYEGKDVIDPSYVKDGTAYAPKDVVNKALGDTLGKGIRQTLNDRGISNDRIGWNASTGTITVDNVDTGFSPKYNIDGTTYDPEGVNTDNITMQAYKQAGTPLVAARSDAASRGYGNAVGWDGTNVTLGGMSIKPVLVRDGIAYVNPDEWNDAVKTYEGNSGIKTNAAVLDEYKQNTYSALDKALNAVLNRDPYRWDSANDKNWQDYVSQQTQIANDAMSKVINQSKSGGLNGYIAGEAMAARDNVLNSLQNKQLERESELYGRYKDSYDMMRNDISDIMDIGNDYYNKLYQSNRDAITDARDAGSNERADYQQYFDNDITSRQLALDEMLSPYNIENARLTNEGLGITNEGQTIQNRGYELDNDAKVEDNRAAIIDNRFTETVQRGFFIPEDEQFFPWLADYRNPDGKTYSRLPSDAEMIYNFRTQTGNQLAAQDVVNGVVGAAIAQIARTGYPTMPAQ